jgi:hypothetical protein
MEADMTHRFPTGLPLAMAIGGLFWAAIIAAVIALVQG